MCTRSWKRARKKAVFTVPLIAASWEKMGDTYTSGNYYQEITCDPKKCTGIITDTYYKVSDDGGKTVRNLGEINKHIDNHCIWIDPNFTDHLLVGC